MHSAAVRALAVIYTTLFGCGRRHRHALAVFSRAHMFSISIACLASMHRLCDRLPILVFLEVNWTIFEFMYGELKVYVYERRNRMRASRSGIRCKLNCVPKMWSALISVLCIHLKNQQTIETQCLSNGCLIDALPSS